MTPWYYANRMCPEILTVMAHASGPDHLFMGSTRRPRQGNGYGFFQTAEEAQAFLGGRL